MAYTDQQFHIDIEKLRKEQEDKDNEIPYEVIAAPIEEIENKQEETHMAQKINEIAKAYESNATKNISDLAEVSTELDVVDDEFEITDKQTGEVKTVKQKLIIVNGAKYRIPLTVFGQLKMVLEDNPNLKKFKVKKSGMGMETRYQVIPLGL